MLKGRGTRDIGDLDREISIYSVAESDTGYGYDRSVTLVTTTFAQEVPKTRKMMEEIIGGKESSMQETHWRVRAEETASTQHELLHNGVWYDIITILPEGRDYKVLVTELKHDAQWPGTQS